MIFALGIHYLWRIRNQELFESYVPSDDQVIHRFWAVFHSQQSYENKVAILLNCNTPSLRHVSWFPPAEGWRKCNFDGSINNHNRASYAWLAQDALGHFWGGGF